MSFGGQVLSGGSLGLQIIKKDKWVPEDLRARLAQWSPKSDLGRIIQGCFGYLPPQQAGELLDAITKSLVIESKLSMAVRRLNGRTEDYGVVGQKVVTTAGVTFLCLAWSAGATLANLKFHGLGTGSVAESTADTALGTELTTEYNPDGTRATGSEVASTNTLTSVGTNTLDGTPGAALREHGIFSQAGVGGTLWDRTVYGAVNIVSGEAAITTYVVTFTAGG